MSGLVPLALAGWAVTLAFLERAAPLRATTHALAPRLLTNLLLAGAQLAAAAWIVAPAASSLRAAWGAEDWGLIPALGAEAGVAAALGVAALDASFYLWHRAMHAAPVLWRLHRVHHSDPDLDVTTALRFHPGEVILSLALRLAQMMLLGVSTQTFLLYGAAFQASVLFHHSNLRLPRRLDRALSWAFVTPRLHGVHHSRVPAETDSNFGVLTSLWDRAAGTLRRAADDRSLRIGLREFPAEPHNRPLRAFALPFLRAPAGR